MELWKLWFEKRKTNTGCQGPAFTGKTGPDRLPVGDEQKKRERSDHPVNKEDHEQVSHDVPEMEFCHGEHGNRPERLDHVSHHIRPRKGDDGGPHSDAQLLCSGNDVRGNNGPLAASGRNEVVEKSAIPVNPEGKCLCRRDRDESLCEGDGKVSEFKEAKNAGIERKLKDDSPDRLSAPSVAFKKDQGLQ